MKKIVFTLVILFLAQRLFSQGFLEIGEQLGLNYDFETEEYGGGVSFVDFNQDGKDDLTFATAAGEPIRFHLNNGNGFTEIAPLIDDTSEVKQVLWIDYNNDGNLDLYITSVNQNKLYKNLGGLTLIDVTESVGFNDPNLISYCATWLDYDNDGWLDLSVAHRTTDHKGSITLYRNTGSENFEDFTTKAGLQGKGNSVLAMTSFDLNNDGWTDLFLAQDHEQGNQLLRNNANGTFKDISFQSNTNQKMNSMTATTGDINGDGWLDIYVSNTREGNILLLNNADETFKEVADEMNLNITSLTFGSLLFDADNDMDLDLHVAGGQANYMFENPGNGLPFKRMNGPWGFEKDRFFNNGLASGDYNNDGYLDLVKNSMTWVSVFKGINTFWENKFSDNNYLAIDLEGTISNKNAIGARITVVAGGVSQMRRIAAGESYSSQLSYTQFFGLAQSDVVDKLTIYWPSGTQSEFSNLTVNQRLSFEEPTYGCTDITACNYNPQATQDNGSCRFPMQYYDCTGCLNDEDGDGVCDELEIPGCMDPLSCNFDPNATETDGNCQYLETFSILGETKVIPFEVTEYNYPSTDGSTYTWSANNGSVLIGQGSSTVQVIWHDSPNGELSVYERNSNDCESEIVTQSVEKILILSTFPEHSATIKLYPNPVNGYLFIEAERVNNQHLSIVITDLQGNTIYKNESAGSKQIVETQEFPDGLYHVIVQNGAEKTVSKIIVTHDD